MKRIDTATRAIDLFGAGKDGFKDGNLALGVAPTDFNAAWPNGMQEEVLTVIEAAGLTPDGADLTQLRQAIAKLTTGRLLRTLVYSRVAGVQNVSIDGAAPTSVGASLWSRSASMVFAEVEVQGAGGAGAGASGAAAGNASLGAPGGAGSYGVARLLAAAVGASQAITVGAKGTKVAGGAGTSGGASSIGALVTAPGGTGGGILNNQTVPAVNGNGGFAAAPSGANLFGSRGAAMTVTSATSAVPNGMVGGTGGTSRFGAGATGPAGNVGGIDAVNYGAGGSGIALNSGGGTGSGGDGGDGIIIIREYA